MALASETFRIIVGSALIDLKEERNALQEIGYPELRKLCMQHGFRFQAIDLRWGVSKEASLSQETMRICLREIERCQEATPRPKFIIGIFSFPQIDKKWRVISLIKFLSIFNFHQEAVLGNVCNLGVSYMSHGRMDKTNSPEWFQATQFPPPRPCFYLVP